MRAIAHKYPLDFLAFLSNFELQPEPEVLGEIDASDVMLPRRLTVGSTERCPRGTWDSQLHEYRVIVNEDDRAAKAEHNAPDAAALGSVVVGVGTPENSRPSQRVSRRRSSVR